MVHHTCKNTTEVTGGDDENSPTNCRGGERTHDNPIATTNDCPGGDHGVRVEPGWNTIGTEVDTNTDDAAI